MDYGKTLNLPSTEFSMRANLPTKEPQMLESWGNLYEKLMQKNQDKPLYVLHDGPPYANGDIHTGHAMNKILKDMIVRQKNMSGYRAPYVPGWDTHGLPIERQAIAALGINRQATSVAKFREICHEFALKYVANQREQFKRLGAIGDWENPYLTLDKSFEAKQIEMFGTMAQKGYIYKGLKPVYWCYDCETALAEAEVEYQDEDNLSIYVKFPVTDDKGLFSDVGDKVYFVIWTTTTWTLPGNVAICVNKDFEYSLVKAGEEVYVLATDLVADVMNTAGITDYSVIKTVMGDQLELMNCRHPFLDRDSLVIVGDHVTLEAGTGCVHTAPGHGVEDFDVCRNYKQLPIVVPVDDKGILTEEAGPFSGMFFQKANKAIAQHLIDTGAMLTTNTIEHTYPHCWRCKHPILFRATEQWFASVEDFKKETLQAIHDVKWIPGWGEDRIASMVEGRNDWCISRQRVWGVPIPIFYCADCGKELINADTIKIVADLFREKGADSWFTMEADEILGEGFPCECGCSKHTKETDIMDVWFDSGSSSGAVLHQREDLHFPADLYLEGNDQYRGWFQSSLLISMANYGVAPFKEVLTHGFVVDGEGKKMSKSLGNGIDPMDVVKEYGADILRLWVASADYKSEVRFSKDILKQLSEGYRKIRNTARYILGNISDFDPKTDMVAYDEMLEMDKWALTKLNELVIKSAAAYDNFEFYTLYHAAHKFCVVDMSNFYLDIIKDRLYAQKADSTKRRSAQSAMYLVLSSLTRILAPVLAFSCEEIWAAMPHTAQDNTEYVLFNDMPLANSQFENSAITEKYDRLLQVRSDVSKALELARGEKIIGQSLGAEVTIFASGDTMSFLQSVQDMLETIFIVSKVTLSDVAADEKAIAGEETDITVLISQAPGEKCERCWIFDTTVGQNSEHETLCSRCADVLK